MQIQKAPSKTGLDISNKIFENTSLLQKVTYNTYDYHNFAINRFWKIKKVKQRNLLNFVKH